ncbi:hypothetical protein HRI_000459800 [Hibiscus trionum]|uniref:Integrase catalytic domain-containing protein n=1 Tax=Hibiscus trionum TaxID=183268 RepID=A0A9W7GYL2_HIBTR|nr:hypothetical protein HRI_000459800 [Hibiscus trionum]
MMGLDYEVQYRRGIHNIVADALSRRPEESSCATMGVSHVSSEMLDKIKETWQVDDKLKKLIKTKEEEPDKHPKYQWDGELLKRKGKLVVGSVSDVKKELLNFFHNSMVGGHSGVTATIQRISAVLYWKGMKKDVKGWVRDCLTCQRNKGDKHHPRGLLQPLPIPETLWSSIGMDFIEGLPKSGRVNCILVVVDRLTKYSHFLGLIHPFTAKDVAQAFLKNVFKLHGLPSNIVCDRDKVFMSVFWKELFGKLGVVVHASTAYHPETDGQTERVNQCLETYLRCMTGERPKDWSEWLHLVEWWYNTTFHSAIRTTPYQALYGQPPPIHLPYIAGESLVEAVDRSLQAREAAIKMLKFHLQRAQDRMKSQADRKRKECEYLVGDWVFLKLQPYRQQSVSARSGQKLASRWFGPFRIIERIGAVAYKLDLPANSKVHPVFHVSQLKKRVGSEKIQEEWPIIDADGSISKEPLRVIDRRIGRKGNRAVTEVLVEWSNSFPEDATWESLHELKQQFPAFNP